MSSQLLDHGIVKTGGVDEAPAPRSLASVRPTDRAGWFHVTLAILLTTLAIGFSCSGMVMLWLLGQVLLSLVFLSWFALLHEAGHKNLFRSQRLNTLAGHSAGILALIPFRTWRLVHARHHYWTGWHDLDPTTSATLPRPVPRVERLAINLCWFAWIPVFSVIYRIQNYWNLPRLWRQFERGHQRRLTVWSTVICLTTYLGLVLWLGPMRCLALFGLGLYLSFALQDVIILSQHSHIPMEHSGGKDVQPFPPIEQEVFTRSLLFPRWFSQYILLNFDAHELHHMYPAVPGYALSSIPYRPANAVPWWQWIWNAKRIPGHRLIFQNRNETGWDL